MESYKRIRSNAWHSSATVARVVEEAERCSCFVQGNNCSTSDCINRTLLIECSPQTCECGDRCANQRLQRGKLPRTKCDSPLACPGPPAPQSHERGALCRVVHVSDAKGYGMVAIEAISAGALVAEYIGEVISQGEVTRRMKADYSALRHTYFMTYTRGLSLDATVRGGLARFINHSCGPNCETQKWIVKGETRVGIFARRRIEPGEELTYDYQLEWNGFARVRCACGAENCNGWLGGDKQQRLDVFALADSDDEGAEAGLYEADEYGGLTKVQQLSEGGVTLAALTDAQSGGGALWEQGSGVLQRAPTAEGVAALDRQSSDEQLLQIQPLAPPAGSESEEAPDDASAAERPPVGRASIEHALRSCIEASRHPHTRHQDLAGALATGFTYEACERADAQFEAQFGVVAGLIEAMQAVGDMEMPKVPMTPLGRLRSSAVQR